MHSRVAILVVSIWTSLWTGALSSPTPVEWPKANRVRQEASDAQSTACGYVIDQVNDGYAYFYATDAYECLTSVPFNPAVAIRFVDYVNTTLQFQSTLAYLKSPPVEYQQPAVDVLGQLQNIKANITKGVYKNQYQFEIDLQHLLYATHDAHVHLTAGITAAFSFQAPFSITAASSNGKSLPQVYITTDVLKNWKNEGWTPSPIEKINNQTAVEYLTKIANLNSFGGVEAHADWNQLFSMPALDINGDQSVWDGYVNFFPGDEIELTVENGTEYLDYWLALYNEPYQTGPLTTGGDFYNYFVLGLLPASYNESDGFYNAAYAFNDTDVSDDTTPAEHSWKNISQGAYPDPDVAQDGLAVLADGVVSGYYLRDVDAAVLSIPTFGQTGYSIGNFSAAVSYFLGNVTKENITRVVIDLQQNTGGTVELAFSTFKRFFPGADPFGGSRRRIHPLADALGEAYTDYFDSLTEDDTRYNDFVADEWVVTTRLNAATGQNFSSWGEYYGPILQNGDYYSRTERYNLSSYDFDAALFEGWVPRGYTPQEPFEDGYTQPFEVENIVLLTDGVCSSTCALLVEMFTQVGVKTTVAGGLPTTGPMQAVGGNRGAALWSSDQLDQHINTLNITGPNVPQLANDGYRDSGVFTTVLEVNLRDQIRPNETEPLQFKYEAADCRLFYTLDNVYNMSRLWRDVVGASFDNPSLCVEGSTGFRNSSKPAPAPLVTPRPSLPFDFTEPDDFLIAPDLDLSGGLEAVGETSRSGRIEPCQPGCNFGSQCVDVLISSCRSPAQQVMVKRCVPFTKGQDFCPTGTTWKKGKPRTLKTASNPLKPSAFGVQESVVSTGPCTPDAAAYCG